MCEGRCLQQLRAELSGGALPCQRRVWRRPSLICASSSREYTQNRPKSIKKCKWSPQIVYIINFIHNSQEKYGSFQYKLAKQTRWDALQPRHSRLGDNLSSVTGPVWPQRSWENMEWRMGTGGGAGGIGEKVGKRRGSRDAKSLKKESNCKEPKKRTWKKDGMKGKERREKEMIKQMGRSKENDYSVSPLPASFAGYSSFLGKGNFDQQDNNQDGWRAAARNPISDGNMLNQADVESYSSLIERWQQQPVPSGSGYISRVQCTQKHWHHTVASRSHQR